MSSSSHHDICSATADTVKSILMASICCAAIATRTMLKSQHDISHVLMHAPHHYAQIMRCLQAGPSVSRFLMTLIPDHAASATMPPIMPVYNFTETPTFNADLSAGGIASITTLIFSIAVFAFIINTRWCFDITHDEKAAIIAAFRIIWFLRQRKHSRIHFTGLRIPTLE